MYKYRGGLGELQIAMSTKSAVSVEQPYVTLTTDCTFSVYVQRNHLMVIGVLSIYVCTFLYVCVLWNILRLAFRGTILYIVLTQTTHCHV